MHFDLWAGELFVSFGWQAPRDDLNKNTGSHHHAGLTSERASDHKMLPHRNL